MTGSTYFKSQMDLILSEKKAVLFFSLATTSDNLENFVFFACEKSTSFFCNILSYLRMQFYVCIVWEYQMRVEPFLWASCDGNATAMYIYACTVPTVFVQ